MDACRTKRRPSPPYQRAVTAGHVLVWIVIVGIQIDLFIFMDFPIDGESICTVPCFLLVEDLAALEPWPRKTAPSLQPISMPASLDIVIPAINAVPPIHSHPPSPYLSFS